MNEIANIVFNNIISRRSVRSFAARSLLPEDLEIILQAANTAPSAGGLKSRKFVIIDNQNDLNFVIKYIFSRRVHEYRKLFINVPCIILMCANISSARKKYRRGRLYAIQDTALAGQNIMLMANALGISSCWIGQLREKKIMEKFNISNDYKLTGIIALGYAA